MTEDEQYEELCDDLGPKLHPIFIRALTTVERGGTVAQRHNTLLALVKQAMDFVDPYTPCAKGCSHCCHMAVTVTETEAKRIAAHIGRPFVSQQANLQKLLSLAGSCDSEEQAMGTAKEWQKEQIDKWTRVPCVFLEDNACSIYSVRPLACRLYHTIAPSNEPCRLGQAGERLKEVPQVDMGAFHMAQVMVDPRHEGFGDIRDWFPEGRKT